MQKIILWASGNGTNARALIEASRKLPNIKILGVLSDNPGARVNQLAQELEISTFIVDMKRPDLILKLLQALEPDWGFLAGFMRILPIQVLEYFKVTSPIINSIPYPYRILNIHPSLLPKYPGLRAIERSFERGDSELGVTVHFVEEGLDTGPVLFQDKFLRLPHHSLEEVKKIGQKLEHRIYVRALKWVAELESKR